MRYVQPVGGQIFLFFRSIGFGFLLGVLYDALRFLRIAAGKKKLLLLWDVLFGVCAAVSTFLYLLVCCDGQMRLFVFAAFGIGIAVWFVFVAPAVRRRSDRFLRTVHGQRVKIAAACRKAESRRAARQQALCEKFTKTLKKFQKSQKTS